MTIRPRRRRKTRRRIQQKNRSEQEYFFGTTLYGLLIEDRAIGLFVRESGTGQDDHLGWRDESGRGAESARDEAGGWAGDLSHGRCEARGGHGHGGIAGCGGSK